MAARELRAEGHSVTVYEQGSQVGGVWVLDENTEDDPLGLKAARSAVHSSMYDTLRTNLPREVMGYADFPFMPEAMNVRLTDWTHPFLMAARATVAHTHDCLSV